MRVNSRRRQHERSRRSQLDSPGRLEIRQLLVNYYVDTRGHRRGRLTFQESLRAMATMNVMPAPSSPPSLTSRPVDAHVRGVNGRDVNDEVSKAPNTDSLTFSSIAAASTALQDNLLHLGCCCLDTLDVDTAKPSSGGSQIVMATPTPAFVNALVVGETISHESSSFMVATGIMPMQAGTATQTSHDESISLVPHINSATGCIRHDADYHERVYAFSTLRGGLARVLNVNSVFASVQEQRVELASRILVAPPTNAKGSDAGFARAVDAMANMDKLRSDTGGTDLVMPIFPPLERWLTALRPAKPATLTQSERSAATVSSSGKQVDCPPKNRQVEMACSVVQAASLETTRHPRVLRALSLISVRLGYRGSVSLITKSTTSQVVIPKPWRHGGDRTMPQLVLPVAATGSWEGDADDQPILAMMPLRMDIPSQSKELTENGVSLIAA